MRSDSQIVPGPPPSGGADLDRDGPPGRGIQDFTPSGLGRERFVRLYLLRSRMSEPGSTRACRGHAMGAARSLHGSARYAALAAGQAAST